MSDREDQNSFFETPSKDDKRFVEIPSDVPSPYAEPLPSGFDPMGHIHLQGRAYDSISGGRMPWWITIATWVVFGLPALFMLGLGLVEDVTFIISLFNQPEAVSGGDIAIAIVALIFRFAIPAFILYILLHWHKGKTSP